MKCNNEIYTLVQTLTKQQMVQFAISCLKRVVGLYEQFEKAEISKNIKTPIPQNRRVSSLNSILSYIWENEDPEVNKITEYRNLLETLIIDDEEDDSSVESVVGGYVVTGILAILDFFIDEDKERIFWCSDCIIEILNQVKSEEYYVNYPEMSDDEIEKKLDVVFTNEVKLQKQIIVLVKSNSSKHIINDFIQENIISS